MFPSVNSMCQVFEYLPGIMFFTKDLKSRFVMANAAFVEYCGAKSFDEIEGKTDHSFFEAYLALSYLNDDKKILAGHGPLIDQLELAENKKGSIDWLITSKFPLVDKKGNIVGVSGVARRSIQNDATDQPLLKMNPVISYIRDHYAEKIELSVLAALLNLSVSQFEKNFKKIFSVPPMEYINQVRIQASCRALLKTDISIGALAQQMGFYDNSYFTRTFIKLRGVSPSQYRRQEVAKAS